MSGDKVASLIAHRLGIRADVLKRYEALKGRGVADVEARNIASAQAAVYGETKPRHRAGVYRRELDAMLAPRRHALQLPDPSPPRPRSHWRLPV